MQIQIEAHALLRAKERGATESEITETIETGTSISAKGERLHRQKYLVLDKNEMAKYTKRRDLKCIK